MEQVQPMQRSGGRVVRRLRDARDFLVAVRAELGKVTWPTQPELIKATRMVIILSVAFGIVLGLLDLVLTRILIDAVAGLSR